MIKKSIKLSTIELGTIATGLDLLLCWLPLRDHDKVEGAEQDQVVVIAEPKFLRHTYNVTESSRIQFRNKVACSMNTKAE